MTCLTFSSLSSKSAHLYASIVVSITSDSFFISALPLGFTWNWLVIHWTPSRIKFDCKCFVSLLLVNCTFVLKRLPLSTSHQHPVHTLILSIYRTASTVICLSWVQFGGCDATWRDNSIRTNEKIYNAIKLQANWYVVPKDFLIYTI